jgi:hypothetical protein
MRSIRRAVRLAAFLTIVAGAGCSESTSGPEGPSVAGTWTGEFRGAAIRMVLNQSGETVTGTLDVGPRGYALQGTVSVAGSFEWTTDMAQADCSAYASSGLQLQAAGSELSGLARRASSRPPCGSSGRVLVEQGTMAMSRAF